MGKAKSTTKKPAVKKTASRAKPAKRAAAPAKKKSSKTKARPAKAKAGPKQRAPAIGRPLVSQEEKLYMLFHDDYHARSIFEFLRAESVHDLERFSPGQIVKLLSQPIQETVLRIRRKLAELNRYLAGDEAFAIEHKRSLPRAPRTRRAGQAG